MKRFIDDVAVEVIEVGLVSVLVDILSPVAVYQMETELVAQIAGESEDNQSHREQLNRQLDVLGKGAEICKQFAFVKISGKITSTE
jgi:sRNA-binding carbon storage regulator CsrA